MARITIYTDASFDQSLEVGGWASWIKTEGCENILCGGIIKSRISNSTEAELCAIANGVYVAMRKRGAGLGDLLIVVTDSLNAQLLLQDKRRNISSIERKIYNQIMTWRLNCGWSLKVNKVKAHNGQRDGKRSYVNNLVDQTAKSYLQQARAQAAQGVE